MEALSLWPQFPSLGFLQATLLGHTLILVTLSLASLQATRAHLADQDQYASHRGDFNTAMLQVRCSAGHSLTLLLFLLCSGLIVRRIAGCQRVSIGCSCPLLPCVGVHVNVVHDKLHSLFIDRVCFVPLPTGGGQAAGATSNTGSCIFDIW